jgi:hypothetical protein
LGETPCRFKSGRPHQHLYFAPPPRRLIGILDYILGYHETSRAAMKRTKLHDHHDAATAAPEVPSTKSFNAQTEYQSRHVSTIPVARTSKNLTMARG